MAKKQEEGQFFSIKSSLIFSAFTHEAFLNTVGPKIIPFWDALEYLGPQKKLQCILKSLKHKPNFGARPYQTLSGLFKFRNQIVHGREHKITGDKVVVPEKEKGDYLDALQVEWEKYCTLSNAEMAYQDIEAIAKDIMDVANIKYCGSPFGSLASGTYMVEENT